LDELLDGRIGQIQQWTVLLGGFGLLRALFFGSCCVRHHVTPGRAGIAASASGRGRELLNGITLCPPGSLCATLTDPVRRVSRDLLPVESPHREKRVDRAYGSCCP